MTDEVVPGMADAIDGRRRLLRLRPGQFAEAAGLTPQGLDPVRKGYRRNYSEKTLDGVAAALRWPDDWYERILDGEDPQSWQDVVHLTVPPTASGEGLAGGGDPEPREFRVAALELQQAAGAAFHILRSTTDALEARDIDAALTLLDPLTSTMHEVNSISGRLMEMDPTLAEDVETTLEYLLKSMEKVSAVLQRSRDEVKKQLDADVAELAELEATMDDESLTLAADDPDLGTGGEPEQPTHRPSPEPNE